MPDILIRNLSEDTVAALKARAKKNNRSAQSELTEIVEAAVRASAETEFWIAAARVREELRGRWLGDSADLIREDRDSR